MKVIEDLNHRIRRNFGKIDKIIDIPNLIEIQKVSYERFLQKDEDPETRKDIGLQGAFKSVFPISDFSGSSSLEFIRYTFEEAKYSEEECLKRSVVLGAWPNTPTQVEGDEAIELYAQYLPLYPYLNRRVLCFEPDPIRLDHGLEGELYTVGRDYAAGISRPLVPWTTEPGG